MIYGALLRLSLCLYSDIFIFEINLKDILEEESADKITTVKRFGKLMVFLQLSIITVHQSFGLRTSINCEGVHKKETEKDTDLSCI